jgi:sugar lactone lactonase YvrE
LLLTKQLKISYYDIPIDIATDDASNVYFLVKSRGRSVFIAKYSKQGSLQWKKEFGASYWENLPDGVATDDDGNVYITGSVVVSKIDPNFDAIIAKYSPDGTLLWTKRLGTSAPDFSYGIATYGDDVYISGATNGSLNGLNQGISDAFVAKYLTRR